MNNLIKFLASTLQEGNGTTSSMRVVMMIYCIAVLSVWVSSCFGVGEVKPVDPSIIALVGVILTGKTIQRFGEKG